MTQLKRYDIAIDMDYMVEHKDGGYYLATAADAELSQLSLELERLAKIVEQLLQDRLDYSSVKTTDGMNASEWVWRTGKAERLVDELRAEVERLTKILEMVYQDCGGAGYLTSDVFAEVVHARKGERL